MQPSPIAEISGPRIPSLRFCTPLVSLPLGEPSNLRRTAEPAT
jgi:hypothetical protein